LFFIRQDAYVAGESMATASCLYCLARGTELVPPGLTLKMQTV
jgi:hypothetical protein